MRHGTKGAFLGSIMSLLMSVDLSGSLVVVGFVIGYVQNPDKRKIRIYALCCN